MDEAPDPPTKSSLVGLQPSIERPSAVTYERLLLMPKRWKTDLMEEHDVVERWLVGGAG